MRPATQRIKWLHRWECRRRLQPRTGLAVLGLLTVAGAVATTALPPIVQDPDYHRFADQRSFLSIQHCFNVISNLAFVAVGAFGCRILLKSTASHGTPSFAHPMERLPWWVFYLGVVLTGVGSAYYHLAPDNARLVWDRLPMTLIFMSFLAALVTERIDVKIGCALLLPLLCLGAATVVSWHLGEQQGCGDLRPYAFVHFFPVLLITFIVWGFPSSHGRDREVVGLLILYSVATVFETLDRPVFIISTAVSGHSLKHLIAAMAVFWHTTMLSGRSPTPDSSLLDITQV